MNNKTVVGIILVIVGAWMALKIVGITLGPILGFLFPLILIGLGVLGLKNGSKTIGSILLVVGAIILLGKLSGLIFFLLAVGLIVWGVSMFKGKGNKRTY